MDGETGEAAGGDDRDDAGLVADQRDDRDRGDGDGWPLGASGKAAWPENVQGEEHRQVDDHADDGGRDGRQRGGQLRLVARRLDQRRAAENEDEGRQEGEPGDRERGGNPGNRLMANTEDRMVPATGEADERNDHD